MEIGRELDIESLLVMGSDKLATRRKNTLPHRSCPVLVLNFPEKDSNSKLLTTISLHKHICVITVRAKSGDHKGISSKPGIRRARRYIESMARRANAVHPILPDTRSRPDL